MGVFKCLAYVAGGVGAIVLAPVTGGGSLAVAIGAMGTTTAAGAIIGASIGATAAAIDHAASSKDDGRKEGFIEGSKAGEKTAQTKYEKRVQELTLRFKNYQDFDSKLVAMYAVGLAIANADGHICNEEREELDAFVSGCMAGNLPNHMKETIASLTKKPPTLERALEFAIKAKLPKQDIDDIISVIANADNFVNDAEKAMISHWQTLSLQYQFA